MTFYCPMDTTRAEMIPGCPSRECAERMRAETGRACGDPRPEWNTYTVAWTIEVEAESYEDAARQALEIQRDPDSDATVFSVGRGMGGPVIDSRTIDLSA
jgi:hypothetical protein